MKDPLKEIKSRRELLRSLCRSAALTCLVFVGAVAALKKRPAQAGVACTDPALCRSCGVFKGCGLPPARMARQTRKEKKEK